MTMEEVLSHTFKAMNSELGISQHADNQPLWQRRLSTASVFCQALVANNYLTTEQMQRAAQRYRLGASRDGGVIFWQIDESGQLRDGKIMHYHPDCHRDHDRRPTWISYLLRKYGKLPEEWKSEHCLFGLHLLPLLSRKGYGSASFAREWGQGGGLYLQPCDTGDPQRNKVIVEACIRYIEAHPQWRLSLQTHKLIGFK